MKTVYIAGKISDLPMDQVQSKFAAAEALITAKGYKAINPLTLRHNQNKQWESYMRECLSVLLQCDAVYLLPCWSYSQDARLEAGLAMALKMPISENHNEL